MTNEQNLVEIKKEKAKRYHMELSSEQGKVFAELADRMNITLSTVVKLLLQDKYLSCKIGNAPVLVIDFDE
ncbi:unnamed protein product [marine sediment metagenome]|uniref:Uncharacterized protein n=1 Tax=marine sediment metagenome TaxID=412755 RepID=X1JTH0_9ZZZZ